MRVIIETSYRANDGTCYRCAECGDELETLRTALRHAKEINVGKWKPDMRPHPCKNAGKQCNLPSVECEEIVVPNGRTEPPPEIAHGSQKGQSR